MKPLLIVLFVSICSFAQAKENCNGNANFLSALSNSLEKKKKFELMENNIVIDQGTLSFNRLHSRIAAVTIEGNPRRVFFIGIEYETEKVSYVFSAVDHSNKLFDKIARHGTYFQERCILEFNHDDINYTSSLKISAHPHNAYMEFKGEEDILLFSFYK